MNSDNVRFFILGPSLAIVLAVFGCARDETKAASDAILTADNRFAVPANFDASILDINPDWYASDEARDAADNVLLYQSNAGAWPKNTDVFAPATAREIASISSGSRANTIDNSATTLPLQFIALVAQAEVDTEAFA